MCGCEHHWDSNAPCSCKCPEHEGVRREMESADPPYRELLILIVENVHIGVSNEDIVVGTETIPAPADLRALLSALIEEDR